MFSVATVLGGGWVVVVEGGGEWEGERERGEGREKEGEEESGGGECPG